MNTPPQDPCPCGSGKTFAECCGAPTSDEAGEDALETGIGAAIDWLFDHHREGMRAAFSALLDDLLDDEELDQFHALDPELLGQLQIHLIEWLLAQGSLLEHGVPRRIADVVLGRDGPELSVAQREWFEALSTSPIGLYRVADVGDELRLVNLIDPDLAVITVHANFEREHLARGLVIGARVLHLHQHSELSGPVYDLRMVPPEALDEMVRQLTEEFSDPVERDRELGLSVMTEWLLAIIEADGDDMTEPPLLH